MTASQQLSRVFQQTAPASQTQDVSTPPDEDQSTIAGTNSQSRGDRPLTSNVSAHNAVIWQILFLATGIILLLSAALKVAQTFNDPVLAVRPTFYSPALFQLLIVAELILGFWCLLRQGPRLCAWLTMATFLGFSAFNAYQISAGVEHCGCYGDLAIPTWISLMLDLILAVGMATFLIKTNAKTSVNTFRIRLSHCLIAAAILLASTSANLNLRDLDMTTQMSDKSRSSVIVRPRSWIGQRCPVLDQSTLPAKVGTGKWQLMLYVEGCKSCQRRIEKELLNGNRIAMVVLPPEASRTTTTERRDVIFGAINDERRWMLDTPVPTVLELEDGIVIGIEEHRPLLE